MAITVAISFNYLVTKLISYTGKARDGRDLADYESGRRHFIIQLFSGHIGLDSLDCGQGYSECLDENGEKAECIDYELPKILGSDDKRHGWSIVYNIVFTVLFS